MCSHSLRQLELVPKALDLRSPRGNLVSQRRRGRFVPAELPIDHGDSVREILWHQMAVGFDHLVDGVAEKFRHAQYVDRENDLPAIWSLYLYALTACWRASPTRAIPGV
jgi:hypothetical protein